MKKTICFLIFVLNLFSVMAQNSNILTGQEPSIVSIQKQEQKLGKKLEKTKCFDQVDKLDYLFIYTLGFNKKPTPELFLRQRLMSKLSFLYRKGIDFPISYAVMYNQEKSVLGYAEDLNVYCFYKDTGNLVKKFEALVNYKLEKKPTKIFQISPISHDLYFAEKEGEAKALLIKEDQPKALEMKDFVKTYWEEYFPTDLLEIYYNH